MQIHWRNIMSGTGAIIAEVWRQPELVVDFFDVVKLDAWWLTAEQTRPCWKLYWNDGPGAGLRYEDDLYMFDQDVVYLIGPNTSYVPIVQAVSEHLYIHFRVLESGNSNVQGIWPISSAKVFGPIDFFRFKAALLQPTALLSHRLLMYSGLSRALSYVLSSVEDRTDGDAAMHKVVSFIEQHLGESIDNDALARVGGFSPDTLRRRFLSEMRRTPQEYVRRLRISRAAQMLQHTDYPIELIAEETGFHDRSHFSKEFKRMEGHAPAHYRKLFRSFGKNAPQE